MLNSGLSDNGTDGVAAIEPPEAVPQDADRSMRLQACWIRLWDRWACEQRNVVLYQMHINYALSRERSKLTLAGGRVKRIKQQHQQDDTESRCYSAKWRPARASWSDEMAPDPANTCIIVSPGPDNVLMHTLLDPGRTRDLRVLSTAVDRLRSSGWYFEGNEAHAWAAQVLAGMPSGRFCVRDSRHSEHMFTMDLQTGRPGQSRIMSVRFTYLEGVFWLDSIPRRPGPLRVPKFRCPIELIDYYVRLARVESVCQTLIDPVWQDRCGTFFSWMNMRRPVVKTTAAEFPSLKHMSRLVVNRHKSLITITPTSLPNELIEYLIQYPYSL